MKKFLSVLLALAVGFTFTFGSTMSAFAAWDGSAYDTADEQKEILAAAKNLAVTKAADITENYDSTVVAGSTVTDITTVTIAKADIEKAIDAVYAAQLDEIIDADSTDLNDYVTFAGNYDTTVKNIDCADVVLVADKMLADAKDAGQAYYVKAEKNELEAYKTYLKGLVDQIDTSIYTDTVQASPYTVDGETYDTSAKAAAAWITYYKTVIDNAVLDDDDVTNTTPGTAAKWEASSMKAIYNAVFNAPIAATDSPALTGIVVVKVADTVDSSITTGLTYKLSATLSTKAAEAGNAATLAAAQSSAIAKLAQVVANFKATAAYVPKTMDEGIDAYVAVKTFVINNTNDKGDVDTLASGLAMDAATATGTTYTGYLADGEAYKAAMATAKTKYTTLGYKWDETEAAKAETVALYSIYTGTPVTVSESYLTTATTDYGKIVTTDLTAAAKAAAKVDYSTVIANAEAFGTAPKANIDVYQANVTVSSTGVVSATASGTKYFAKQWDAVKAAYDTYNAAVDAAVSTKDITDAGVVLYKALAPIDSASNVFDKVDDASTTYANINAYAKLVASQAGKTIYVTFVNTDTVTSSGTVNSASVYAWMVNQGASTKAEADALYATAKTVVDAYKTLDDLKAEAAKVQAEIAALPATATLADKAAVVAAADAYAALTDTSKDYITNKTTLDKAVAAVKAAEEYALKSQAANLPKTTNAITVADKAAITAYKDAYEAYTATKAYASYDGEYTASTYSFGGETGYVAALLKVKDLEATAIKAAYDALAVKYQANTLTDADAAAVKELQDALAAYIAEYKAGITNVSEFELSKIADIVGAAVEEANKYTEKDAKAAMFDMTYTLSKKKITSKKYKVTAKAGADQLAELKDNGYTVKYRFYKKAPKKSSYKLMKTTTTKYYSYAKLTKGKNYFKVKMTVYNAEGKAVGSKTKTTSVTIK